MEPPRWVRQTTLGGLAVLVWVAIGSAVLLGVVDVLVLEYVPLNDHVVTWVAICGLALLGHIVTALCIRMLPSPDARRSATIVALVIGIVLACIAAGAAGWWFWHAAFDSFACDGQLCALGILLYMAGCPVFALAVLGVGVGAILVSGVFLRPTLSPAVPVSENGE